MEKKSPLPLTPAPCPCIVAPDRNTVGGAVATADLLEGVGGLASQFAAERAARQSRRELDRTDFDRLRAAGFPLIGLPVEQGGLWDGPARSVRFACDLLRTLAQGDSSVALVCAMHPTVLAFWLLTPHAPTPFGDAWDEQRRRVLRTVEEGA